MYASDARLRAMPLLMGIYSNGTDAKRSDHLASIASKCICSTSGILANVIVGRDLVNLHTRVKLCMISCSASKCIFREGCFEDIQFPDLHSRRT